MKKFLIIILIILIAGAVFSKPNDKVDFQSFSTSYDNESYINANYLLMFITNSGIIGRDLSGMFSASTLFNNPGVFYPYTSIENITNQSLNYTVLYSAGPWLGGKVNDSIRVSSAEYSTEYVPGPMTDSTFLPDDPSFKVYKLYADSMEANPNNDYLNWPISQGAPVDEMGHPRLYGDQTLWTVFNDADSAQHKNMKSNPLGIEVQLTAWAEKDEGNDTLFTSNRIGIDTTKTSKEFVRVHTVDTAHFTGHSYSVITGNDSTLGAAWSLVDNTLDTILLNNIPFSRENIFSPVIDGFQLEIVTEYAEFDQFQVVANANGPLDPPEAGAVGFAGFPTPTDVDLSGNPTDNQQVGPAKWLLHTQVLSTNSGCGSRDTYDDWLYSAPFYNTGDFILRQYDWEIRFTGTYDNPSVGGSYAHCIKTSSTVWVPFELWRIGRGTPDDPSDDLRCFTEISNNSSDAIFNLEYYGSCESSTCVNTYCEHEVSDGFDDPYTDFFYWYVPGFESGLDGILTGDSAYYEYEKYLLGDPNNYIGDETSLFRRLVFVNWDGGTTPPFNQELPEQGTVFRITTKKEIPIDTISFTTSIPEILTSGPEGTSIYLMYKLYNKGINQIDSCFFSWWVDTDLGYCCDQLVGCDTLDNLFYIYNDPDDDGYYGTTPPAVGFKYIHGPLIPAPGETANFGDNIVNDFKNTGMTAFTKMIGGGDPDDALEAYKAMKGSRDYDFTPYVYNNDTLTYLHSGDPVTGMGDNDLWPSSKRVMGTVGPFDFYPGDSQYVLIKMAVGQGSDNLSSITKLREILNQLFSYYLTDVKETDADLLPGQFELSQNYPNPFNPTTTISYNLPIKAKVKLEIFNILGQKVTTLVDAEQTAGTHKIEWDGSNQSGEKVTTGVYLYRLSTEKYEQTKKMLLLK